MALEGSIAEALSTVGMTQDDLGSAGLLMFGLLGWFGVFSKSEKVRFSKFVNSYCAIAGTLITASVWDDSWITRNGMPSMGASGVFETIPYVVQLILGNSKPEKKK